MYCPHCGKSILDGSVFCSFCAKPTAAAPVTAKKSSPLDSALRIFGAVAIIIVAVILYAYISRSIKKNTVSSADLTKAVLAVPAPVTETLLSGDIVVKAGQCQFWTFTIYPEMAKAHLSGSFHASGGAGNDIQAVIATSSEFENWLNGHPARVYYSTEKVTNGQIDVRLVPGTYTIGFSNKFSAVTDKDVRTEIKVQYLRAYGSNPRTIVQPPTPDSIR